ncbi:YciI family protein [Ciceribacter sp. L1K23]|uniref:YciI family protein n=1 Tax=Ciceribacter sp. L1K23 TaxID=2820276 RepID=UPI001B813CB0|nr:YciI family protein [Ciceribacter sp. L1K23]MBR0554606.1 YciI family protein [Ciceribacter sp. L1K23]
MQFMLILNETSDDFARRNDPTQANDYWGGWTAFINAMAQAGVVVKGDGLHAPHTATTLRVRDGKRVVEDGPFADTKEQLAGYFIIEVPDLDDALDWAAKAPSALTASVEVRPVLPPMPTPGQ